MSRRWLRLGLRWTALAGTLVAAAFLLGGRPISEAATAGDPVATPAPARLSETGLYLDAGRKEVDPAHLAFAPQYPLWTDGATKRRWISLPPGSSIDASDPDDWRFPVGTRLWKEFSFDGRPVETRLLWLPAEGSWLYAAYAWSEDGSDAELVAPSGRRKAYPLGGGRFHAIPGTADCKACHEGQPSRVLGFSALQLAPDRDPAAPHAESPPEVALDLPPLVAAGLVTGLAPDLVTAPPRIAAATGTERAALGYLHGNCGHCHNPAGPLANLGLFLRQPAGLRDAGSAPALLTAVGRPARRLGSEDRLRIDPGHPELSLVLERAASRTPALQMPPLGTALADDAALRLLGDWIEQLSPLQERSDLP